MNLCGFSLKSFIGRRFYAAHWGESAGFFIMGHNLNNFSRGKQGHKKTTSFKLFPKSNVSEI